MPAVLARDLSEVPANPIDAALASPYSQLSSCHNWQPTIDTRKPLERRNEEVRQALRAVDTGDHMAAYVHFLAAAGLTFRAPIERMELLRLSREAHHRWQISTLGSVSLASFVDPIP